MSRVKKSAKVAAIACAFVGTWEGVQTVAYPDPATKGHPFTICFGETEGVKKGDRRTIEQCKAGLRDGLDRYGDEIDRCLRVSVPDRTWIAFVSWSWNLGTPRFCSKIAPLVNAGQTRAACERMKQYDTAAGIRMRGLTRRRAAEYELCTADL